MVQLWPLSGKVHQKEGTAQLGYPNQRNQSESLVGVDLKRVQCPLFSKFWTGNEENVTRRHFTLRKKSGIDRRWNRFNRFMKVTLWRESGIDQRWHWFNHIRITLRKKSGINQRLSRLLRNYRLFRRRKLLSLRPHSSHLCDSRALVSKMISLA